MIIYPAIDLRQGRCVRLQQGLPSAQVVFSEEPAVVARRWAAQGAEWLHVVNLDGALGEGGQRNLAALDEILAAVDLPVQFGGGIRTLEDAQALVARGVSRVVLGTAAVAHPEVVVQALMRLEPDQVAVGIDARDGRVAIHGWQNLTEVPALTLGMRMARLGVPRLVYTDVSRDGMLAGVNLDATVQMARTTGLSVTASGGVASIEDIRSLAGHRSQGIDGVIVGMALYRNAIDLSEAIAVAQGESNAR
ncbi:MAG: 1-(5-phosphoribosyl)-5-[(5-phosphoribosylamino)methylideneamino]imidazole-4-carboxamide isomerase [Anaerolineae bacterium]|jgi:phosphoribosylformimino-5-aminoimidazole carboxamide ribotide isomerase|nr:1-(5-phosphoribosyl)-5-[(5-phosphoribosylamino)methylideneamino]imidazole-4-carboxamide isomerase [Chloroflexota bacterium]